MPNLRACILALCLHGAATKRISVLSDDANDDPVDLWTYMEEVCGYNCLGIGSLQSAFAYLKSANPATVTSDVAFGAVYGVSFSDVVEGAKRLKAQLRVGNVRKVDNPSVLQTRFIRYLVDPALSRWIEASLVTLTKLASDPPQALIGSHPRNDVHVYPEEVALVAFKMIEQLYSELSSRAVTKFGGDATGLVSLARADHLMETETQLSSADFPRVLRQACNSSEGNTRDNPMDSPVKKKSPDGIGYHVRALVGVWEAKGDSKKSDTIEKCYRRTRHLWALEGMSTQLIQQLHLGLTSKSEGLPNPMSKINERLARLGMSSMEALA